MNERNRSEEFPTKGKRLAHILDQSRFSKGHGRIAAFHKFLVDIRPEIFGDLHYSTVKGWFQNHSPQSDKIITICNVLNEHFELSFQNVTEVMSWWMNGGHYPFADIEPMSNQNENVIRVFHAEDHEVVLTGVAELLKGHGMTVVGSSTTVSETLEICFVNNPDLIIVDLNMNRRGKNQEDGITFISLIMEQCPSVKILVFSFRKNLSTIISAYQHGVYGYLSKDSDSCELITAIQKIAKGEKYYMPGVAEKIVSETNYGQSPHTDNDPRSMLDDRELSIFRTVSEGRNSETLCKQFNLETHQLEHQIEEICKKLNISLFEFGWIARKYNLIDLDL